MTKTEIIALINSNLADYSGIVPSKHREVELAILNYINNAVQVNAINKGSITVGDIGVGSVGFSYPFVGDVESAKLYQRTGGGNIVLVTVKNAHSNTNYKVDISTPESLGTMEYDNDIRPIVWQKVNETQFYIYIEETGHITQNIKIHFETKLL